MIYIIDIDGTIADLTHRLHYIGFDGTWVSTADSKADWDSFYAAAPDDKPIFEVITVVRALVFAGQEVVYITGRPEETRSATQAWLDKYRLPKGQMYMRAVGDHRHDNIVKGELLDRFMASGNLRLPSIGGAFEDRQQVVDMYRARGIKVFQVAKGDF